MAKLGFKEGVKREIRQLVSRRMYIFGMIIVPIFMAFFFLDLLRPGLPNQVPTAVVDLDHSPMSRTVTRSLEALQVLDVCERCESYDEALDRVRQGKIFGFFVIPINFEKDALSGNSPTLEYYSNMTYFVPGTLAFKGFKTVAVATSGGVVRQTLVSLGATPEQIAPLIQPLNLDIHGLNNPWMNYAIYLCPSFSMATFVLMIMLMTVFFYHHGNQKRHIRKLAHHCPRQHNRCRGIETSSPDDNLCCSRHLLYSGFFRTFTFPTQRLCHVDDYRNDTDRDSKPGSRSVYLLDSAQPTPRFLADSAFRHPIVLIYGIFLPVESMYGWLGIFSYFALSATGSLFISTRPSTA